MSCGIENVSYRRVVCVRERVCV